MNHHDTPTACSCRLPAGHWGAGGWHHGRATEEGLIRMELHRRAVQDPKLRRVLDDYARTFPPDPKIDSRVEREKALVMQQMGDAIKSGVGRPWAYEACPLYRKAVEAAILRRKGEEREKGGGGRFQ